MGWVTNARVPPIGHQRLGDVGAGLVRGLGRVGPSLLLALPLSELGGSITTPSASASGDQEAEALGHISQQCHLSHHQLLLTGSTFATTLGMLCPPSSETHSDSGKSSFPTFSVDRYKSKHLNHSVNCLFPLPPLVLDRLLFFLMCTYF